VLGARKPATAIYLVSRC